MSAQGGSIESLTLDGRRFSVPADSDANTKLGGSENEGQVNGDGTMRRIGTKIGWSITGASVSIDVSRADQEFLNGLSDRDLFAVTLTENSGAVYQGVGFLTGELAKSTQSASMPIELSGPGELMADELWMIL